MSFTFEWPQFSDEFYEKATEMLNTALNKGKKPPIIADRIEVVELEMGTQPPELEIRDIGDLTKEQFRGIFRFSYSGDAHLVLRTKVQANPLNHKQTDIHLMSGSRGMLAAKHALVVPMHLRLSQFKLSSYVVLVVSRQKGITLVFKTDPLQHVNISSTFDSINVIQHFIQREIENILRNMFREDLPGIIHRLSQQWIKAKASGAPPLPKQPAPPAPPIPPSHTISYPSAHLASPLAQQHYHEPPRPRSYSGMSVTSSSRRSLHSVQSLPASPRRPQTPDIPAPTSMSSSFPDLENYDPTYGMRSEGIPNKSAFGGLRGLFTPNKGLADLAEEVLHSPDTDFDVQSVWADESEAPPSEYETPTEFEMIPAVGGGTVTRPRVLHSGSGAIPLSRSGSGSSLAGLQTQFSATFPGSPLSALSPLSPRTPSRISNPYFPPVPSDSALFSNRPYRPSALSMERSSSMGDAHRLSPPSLDRHRAPPSEAASEGHVPRTGFGSNTIPDAPPMDPSDTFNHDTVRKRIRRPSVSSVTMDGFESLKDEEPHIPEPVPSRIVLRPTVNKSVTRLSILSHSHHTLSPFTRSMEHFTVRSLPPKTPTGQPTIPDRPPPKARRKRIHRLSKKTESAVEPPPSPQPPPSEFQEDMDRYFRDRDDVIQLRTPHPVSRTSSLAL